MKIGIKKEVEVDAKELCIYTKVCDCFTAVVLIQGMSLLIFQSTCPRGARLC